MSELTEHHYKKRRNAEHAAEHPPPEKKNPSMRPQRIISNGNAESQVVDDVPQAESLRCAVQRRKRCRWVSTAGERTEITLED